MDDGLLDVILGRIDGDGTLSEGATELLLAACQGDDELAGAVAGEPPPRPTATTAAATAGDAVPSDGTFLASITVEGFRGVGPARTLELHPGTGLTVVAGRNGSGKSSFAEGLEVLLTGSTARFQGYAVFKDGWRNLHQATPTRVEAEFHLGGLPGATVVRRSWADGADLFDGTTTVRVAGDPVTGLDHLGWSAQLATHRPFLAHADLQAMFDGKRSELYDRLAGVLGLGDISETQERLGRHRRDLEAAAKEADATRRVLVTDLSDVDDERAAEARTALDQRRPDIDVVEKVVAAGGDGGGAELDDLRAMAHLPAPDVDAAKAAALALRAAADQLDAVAGTEAARARSLADLLQRAVDLATQHPDETACPVCGRADALDHLWRDHATYEIDRLRNEARLADEAASAASTALSTARSLLTSPGAAMQSDAAAVVDAAELGRLWAAWVAAPPAAATNAAALRTLADHLASQIDSLAKEAEAVRSRAVAEVQAREDRWSPVALRLAAWVGAAREAAANADIVKDLKAAERWLKAAHDDIRNKRLRPIADEAQANWQLLRHESNVALGPIRLAGSSNQRKVVLDATVDGSDGSALGVMSQGEVNALALSVFLPRAMLPESPFRFLVIDDPVQAMDPAKVDGLARVLHRAAQSHQVVVFTHDDRLPNALRRLDLDARVIQVQRREGSIVELSTASSPADKALSDARSIARDLHVPEAIKRRVVPGQCRLALEAALVDVIVRRQLRSGRRHHEIDDMLAEASTLRAMAALAFDDDTGGSDVVARLGALGQRHVATYRALNPGAHGAFSGVPMDLVKDTGRLVEAIDEALP